MKVRRLRWDIVRPPNVDAALKAWEVSDDGKSALKFNPHMSTGLAEGRCLDWLLEEVWVDTDALAKNSSVGYWRDGVRYEDPLELAKLLIEDAQRAKNGKDA